MYWSSCAICAVGISGILLPDPRLCEMGMEQLWLGKQSRHVAEVASFVKSGCKNCVVIKNTT